MKGTNRTYSLQQRGVERMLKYFSLALCLILGAVATAWAQDGTGDNPYGYPPAVDKGPAPSTPEVAEADLLACLAAFTAGRNPADDTVHTFKLVLPGEQMSRVTIQVDGERVLDFDCPRFRIEQDTAGRLTLNAPEAAENQRVSRDLLRNLRWYLSLNPFWVLHRVRNNLKQFTYTEDTHSGLAFYTREETVLLTHPAEKQYGLYREELVIDLTTYTVREYLQQAIMPDGARVLDMFNTYEYQHAEDPAWVNVDQSGSRDWENARRSRVLYK